MAENCTLKNILMAVRIFDLKVKDINSYNTDIVKELKSSYYQFGIGNKKNYRGEYFASSDKTLQTIGDNTSTHTKGKEICKKMFGTNYNQDKCIKYLKSSHVAINNAFECITNGIATNTEDGKNKILDHLKGEFFTKLSNELFDQMKSRHPSVSISIDSFIQDEILPDAILEYWQSDTDIGDI